MKMTPAMPGWFRWLLVPLAAVGATAAAGLPLVAVALAAALVVIVALGSLTRASEIAALGVGRALLLYAALGLSSAAVAIVLVARRI